MEVRREEEEEAGAGWLNPGGTRFNFRRVGASLASGAVMTSDVDSDDAGWCCWSDCRAVLAVVVAGVWLLVRLASLAATAVDSPLRDRDEEEEEEVFGRSAAGEWLALACAACRFRPVVAVAV